MTADRFPRMAAVRQKFPESAPLDIRASLQEQFQGLKLKPAASVAVAVGSRGITNLAAIVSAVVEILKGAGARPFIVPAMGSHGGGTPEGQRGILAGYGVTEEATGAPIRDSMAVEPLGSTEDGLAIHFSAEALRSDGIVAVNRVKPHTDFGGPLGSGVLKMLAIGLGKRDGAAACHAAASRLGHERVIRTVARVVFRAAPVLCGVAIVEDAFHRTSKIAVLKPDELERREEELQAEARRLMARLPFREVELLIIDRIGKNISGSGMDPNVTGRSIHGYSSRLSDPGPSSPVVRRIFVRDLTPETHGNALGIGMADFTTARVVRALDKESMYLNALTALSVQGVKIPIHFETDREAIARAVASLALPDARQARVVRIQDTLSLEKLEVSEAYTDEVRSRQDLEALGGLEEMGFDASGNLPPLGS